MVMSIDYFLHINFNLLNMNHKDSLALTVKHFVNLKQKQYGSSKLYCQERELFCSNEESGDKFSERIFRYAFRLK